MILILLACLMTEGLAAPMVTLEDLQLQQLERRTYVGYAYELGTDTLIYTENHEEFRQQGTLIADRVSYKLPDGTLIASKIVRFDQSSVAPNFHKQDHRTGFTEGAVQQDERLVLMLRRNQDSELKETILKKPANLVMDAGFNQFVIENWDALLNGKREVFQFALPTREEYYKFRLEKTGDQVIEQRKVMVFRMALNAFLFRLLVDDIVVGYDAETKRLSFYKGLSNIRDETGELYQAMIKFPHDGYQDRDLASSPE